MSREARFERKLGDLEVLKKTIEELPRTLSKNVHVPLCEMAFVEGRVERTNEVIVYLGGDLFAKRSAFQANQIIDRRIQRLKTALKDLSATNEEQTLVEPPAPGFVEHCRSQEEEEDLPTYEDFSKEEITDAEHASVVNKLVELEKLEEAEGMGRLQRSSQPVRTGGVVESSASGSEAFSGVVQEREGGEAGGPATREKGKTERVSLFKQRLRGLKE